MTPPPSPPPVLVLVLLSLLLALRLQLLPPTFLHPGASEACCCMATAHCRSPCLNATAAVDMPKHREAAQKRMEAMAR